MITKDVLLVLSGVALGYFASKMNLEKITSIKLNEVLDEVKDTATDIVSDVKDVVVSSEKKARCNKNLLEAKMLMKFSNAEAEKQFEKEFLNDCLASK